LENGHFVIFELPFGWAHLMFILGSLETRSGLPVSVIQTFLLGATVRHCKQTSTENQHFLSNRISLTQNFR